MRWLVTGSTGFIGSHFLGLLDGEEVVTLNARTRLAPQPGGAEHHVGDICDQGLVDTLVGRFRPDRLVHFAAESSVSESFQRPASFVRTNVEGTVCLLDAVRRLSPGTLMVHVSTDEVYGDGLMVKRATSPLAPQNPYAASKAAAEHFIVAYQRAYRLNVAVVRPSNNWGAGQQTPKFIPAALEAKRSGVPMVVHGLDIARDWLCVDDNVKAIFQIAQHGGGVFNVATEELTTLGQILERIGGVPYQVGEERPVSDRRYRVDASATWGLLGWQPTPLSQDPRFDEYVEAET